MLAGIIASFGSYYTKKVSRRAVRLKAVNLRSENKVLLWIVLGFNGGKLFSLDDDYCNDAALT